MNIISEMRKEKKVTRKDDEVKILFRELWHLLEMAEFAEKKGAEELKKSYQEEALGLILVIYKEYGTIISKQL